MALEDTIIIVALSVVAAVAIAACIALILLMRRRTQKPALKKPLEPEVNSLLASPLASSPYRMSKSVQSTDANRAKDELRILDLEREIVADAIRHLYEAQAEGKINEVERERLASSYKNRMMSIKDSIAKDEGIVALHELEGMQEDLMKLFSERFGELSSKVEELRSRIDVKPVKEIKIQMPKPQAPVIPEQMEEESEEEEEAEEAEAESKDKPKKPRKPPAEKQKTEAEQRIDAIRNQIDEVMNKLGQMEMES